MQQEFLDFQSKALHHAFNFGEILSTGPEDFPDGTACVGAHLQFGPLV